VIFDKACGQIIQQFRMAGAIPLEAEIARRLDDPAAEMLFPDAIDNDASGKRRGFGQDRIGQVDPPAAGGQWPRRAR